MLTTASSVPIRPQRAESSFMRSRKPCTHTADSKVVYEGLDGVNLHAALGHTNQLDTLLRKGESPNAIERDGDRTPLHWAAARGHIKCVEHLLMAGASVSAVDCDGRTALILANEFGHGVAVRATLDCVAASEAARADRAPPLGPKSAGPRTDSLFITPEHETQHEHCIKHIKPSALKQQPSASKHDESTGLFQSRFEYLSACIPWPGSPAPPKVLPYARGPYAIASLASCQSAKGDIVTGHYTTSTNGIGEPTIIYNATSSNETSSTSTSRRSSRSYSSEGSHGQGESPCHADEMPFQPHREGYSHSADSGSVDSSGSVPPSQSADCSWIDSREEQPRGSAHWACGARLGARVVTSPPESFADRVLGTQSAASELHVVDL